MQQHDNAHPTDPDQLGGQVQKDLQAASKQVADFSSRLEAAGKQLEAAETKLKAAEKESADTKTSLEQARDIHAQHLQIGSDRHARLFV